MRVWIFTGTLAIIFGVMLVVAELSLREERTVQRAYERFCTAVEAAVDDACEYLSLIDTDEDGGSGQGTEYIKKVFIDSLAAALGKDVSIYGETLEKMITEFVVSKNPDRHSKGGFHLRDSRGKEVILPDQTGLVGYKADSGPSVLVCMVCRLGSGLTGKKDFVCIRNAQLRRLSS